jgi:iron complex transport system ATP-binding protein
VRLQIKNVTFSYNKTPVLDHINFSLGGGKILAIVGPNGSGKSTLLKCIDQTLKPQKGSILLDNQDIMRLKTEEVAKKLGYVPQSNGRSFPATVFDSILMGRKPYIKWAPTTNDLKIVANVIEKLGLQQLALRDINELSGGQKQKVIIGRALAQEPSILLLDEPTSNLDLKHQLEVLTLIKEQTKEKVSAIIAIHDLNLALRYCDKIVMLDKGTVFASGNMDVLTAENIESVYGVKVKLIMDSNRFFVIPEETNGD